MNLDELVNSIPNSESELKQDLKKWIDDWKMNDKNIDDLEPLIGKWHGNVWFKDQQVSNKFYEDFRKFNEKAILGVGGITMIERLYWFGLLDLWDSSDSKIKSIIRLKLKA
jgi:hypothetical protein